MNLESIYGNTLQYAFIALNPFKKMIIETKCEVHKDINLQALNILRNDRYMKEYQFFRRFINDINAGTTWADQDFKSSNHFYNPLTKKGLYGRNNAMNLAKEYFQKSTYFIKIGDIHRAMFYLGSIIHLIQDMTIPQHANIRLLDNHKQYESFVKDTYKHMKEFHAQTGAYQLKSLENYIKFNGKTAIEIYKRFKNIPKDEIRFYKISSCALPLAERTTAGFMLLFFRKMFY